VILSVTATVITVTSITGLVDESAGVDEQIQNAMEDNPFTNQDQIFIGAVYAFERLRRKTNEFLRKFDSGTAGTYKFAGAYELINGRLFGTGGSPVADDRKKLCGSGWLERLANGTVSKIFFGVRSLGNIEDTSQPYYQLTDGGAPTDYAKDGPVNEAIEVTAPADFLSSKVRTFGQNYDEKTLVDSGISEMSGYSAGFALGESPHLTTGAYALADVYGGAKISPWTGMTLEKLATPQTETGFAQADGNFTWVLNNTANGNLNQCVAFLDALAQTDDDIDSGALTITHGKRVRTWYTYDAQGRIVTRSGADSLGLFIENIPLVDRQRIVFTDDAAAQKTYPFNVQITVLVGAAAKADTNAWFHIWEADGYGTSGAQVLYNSEDEEMKGPVNGADVVQAFDWDGYPLGPSDDLEIVVEVEGDGAATQAKTEATLTRSLAISISCAPALETNV
jgi:YD repeat-containing protein